ncbi:MAG: alpha/beta hydrolase [Bacteroidota bacterium]
MKVIFIHGRDQQDTTPTQLRAEWLTAWEKGLAKSKLSLPSEDQVHFPYYADTLHQAMLDLTQTKKGEATRSGSQGINEAQELDFTREYFYEIARATVSNVGEGQELKKMQEAERGLLNWDPVQKLANFLDKKEIFGDYPLRKATRDVFVYLTQNHIKAAVNQIVEAAFDDTPCIVVGHSLGTIVAYLVLKNNPQFQVKKFITIGSPLGISSLAKYLEPPLVMPKSIRGEASDRWHNFYDDRDFVALNPLDKKHFNNGFQIINSTHVKNHTPNRHGMTGYLDDALIAKTIYEAMFA